MTRFVSTLHLPFLPVFSPAEFPCAAPMIMRGACSPYLSQKIPEALDQRSLSVPRWSPSLTERLIRLVLGWHTTWTSPHGGMVPLDVLGTEDDWTMKRRRMLGIYRGQAQMIRRSWQRSCACAVVYGVLSTAYMRYGKALTSVGYSCTELYGAERS
ncbi:hypothetical protein B0T16DRAFT_397225 [Cercophora newfieldiana]|uniref:Uncharacterized protein n=1 Tax=Cercophora newfieldiana TaxID=92897 RepID=A0AA39YN03_9PEZI|nr:hypothetical protein B0T16DRAFT_397225 [Cercophora newfieldiana]